METHTGGDWRFVHRDPDGRETAFRGTFREVTPPERIAWTFEWSGMSGYVSVDIVEFEDLGERSRVTIRSLFFLPEERDGMLEAGSTVARRPSRTGSRNIVVDPGRPPQSGSTGTDRHWSRPRSAARVMAPAPNRSRTSSSAASRALAGSRSPASAS